MSKGKNKSISHQTFLQMIGIVSILTFFAIVYFVYREISRFDKEKEYIKNEYLIQQKDYIKTKVEYVVSYVNYQKEITETRLQNKLIDRVNMANQIAQNIYKENKNTKTKTEIAGLIKDALRPIRFDNGRGYFFIGNFNGTDELFPVAPMLKEQI